MNEPTELNVGDTWTWTEALDGYLAPTWVLTYYFRSREGEFTVVCTASGTDHVALIDATTSALQKAGRYEWSSRVTSGAEAYSIGRGITVIKPDPAQLGAGHDPRSSNRKILEALEAVMEGKATRDQMAYTIGGRSLQRMSWEDLLMARDYFQKRVDAEEATSAASDSRRVTTTFNRI